MAGSGGFSISIAAVDNASKTLDGLNRRLAALSAPAERFNKSVARFGEVSGLNRAAEGLQSVGRSAAEAFRSMDRLASPLASITSAASLAGMVELTRRWADFGNQVGQVSYRLNMPVEKLSALRGGARLAGVSISAMDQSLSGLRDTLYDSAFGRGDAKNRLNMLGIDAGTPGHVLDTAEAMKQLADRVAATKDVHTQERMLGMAGVSTELLPILKGGRKAIEELERKAGATGGLMTEEMVQNATKMNTAWQRLGMDFEGVGNRIVNSWSGTVTNVLTKTSDWIEKNQGLTDSIAKIGTAIMTLGLIKPAAWVLRLLGLGGAAGPTAAAAAVGAGAYGAFETGVDVAEHAAKGQIPIAIDEFGNPLGFRDATAGERGGGGWSRRSFAIPSGPSNAAAVMQRGRAFWRSKGLSEEQTAGMLAQEAAESGFNPGAVGDNGTSYGLYQHHADRLAGLRRRYGMNPTEDQQREYAYWELTQGSERQTWDRLLNTKTARQAGAVATGFERPADMTGAIPYRAGVAEQIAGHVQVDVSLKNAPAGTTAKVTTSGAVAARPPLIEAPMPGY